MARYERQEEFRCVRFDRQRHEGAGKEEGARGGRSMIDPCKHDRGYEVLSIRLIIIIGQ